MKPADWRIELPMQPLAIKCPRRHRRDDPGDRHHPVPDPEERHAQALRNRPLAPARQRPLAGAGLVLAVLSRARGPAPATRDIVSVNAALLLIAALLCAATGAITTTRQQRRGGA
jgi:hypothetical protein